MNITIQDKDGRTSGRPWPPMRSDTHESSTSQPPDIRFYSEENGQDILLNDEPVSPKQLSKAMHQNRDAFKQNADAPSANQSPSPYVDTAHLLHELQVRTDVYSLRRRSSVMSTDFEPRLRTSASATSLTQRVPSIRSWLHSTAGSVSPGSTISSPQIAAMLDITPLPSPTLAPLESWKSLTLTRSRASSTSSRTDSSAPFSVSVATFSPTSPRKKSYFGLKAPISHASTGEDESTPAQNRSISDYIPEPIQVPKPRQHAVSTAGAPVEKEQSTLHREEYLATQRGISTMSVQNHDLDAVDNTSEQKTEEVRGTEHGKSELYSAKSINSGHERSYESIRLLGHGTFSKVYLAIRLVGDRKESVDYRKESTNLVGVRARSHRLVAVKVVELGPAGGANAERIEVSLKREVELMKVILHPSIVHLKAFGTDPHGRALLVMNYCPGGDLFEVASNQKSMMTPSLIRRIFSELVSAVRYLHQKYIVHRDIKLENVLLNIPAQVHNDVQDWQTLDRAVVTLSDLGLSRQIPAPPESPLLETRCGSEDYAAPEILMGQPYDGRQTDAWALGVLLYALMEGRLPFDALPGLRGDPATLKARTPHRIARCEWGWVRYGDEDNEWDSEKGKDLEGAKKCVESLLKRNTRRTPLADVREWPWVRDGIRIDGGLRWVEEEGV